MALSTLNKLLPLFKSGLVGVAILWVTACATGPQYSEKDVDMSVTPVRAAEQGSKVVGARILWAGVILSSANFPDRSQLEVLAYPLGSSQEPHRSRPPQGRFLIVKQGYLETADYAQGRSVTVLGKITGLREGDVGEARYTYPVVEPEGLHLWSEGDSRSNVHFGFGLTIIK